MIRPQPVLDGLKSRSLLCILTMMNQFIRPSIKSFTVRGCVNGKAVLDLVPTLKDLGENRTVKQLEIIL